MFPRSKSPSPARAFRERGDSPPQKRIAPSPIEEAKCPESINILTDFKDKSFPSCIRTIKTFPNKIDNFPKVKEYIKNLENVQYTSVINFNFFNICSQLLFIEQWWDVKNRTYIIIWVINNETFESDPEEYNPLKIKITISTNKGYTCSLEQIATQGFVIPALFIHGDTHVQSAVPMFLALYLVYNMDITKIHLIDNAMVKVNCDGEIQNLRLFDERRMLGRKSMYVKYGFVPEFESSNYLYKITIRRILNDYILKVINVTEFKFQLQRRNLLHDYEEEEFTKNMELLTKLMIELLAIRNKNISLRDWLLQYENQQRNCKTLLLKKLNYDKVNEDFTFGGVIYSRGYFNRLYDEGKDDVFFVNSDIGSVIGYTR
jgi:hypothetical protein